MAVTNENNNGYENINGGITVINRDDFSVRERIFDVGSAEDGRREVYQSASDPEHQIIFDNVIDDFDYPPRSFCEVTIIENGEPKILYTQDETGRDVGSIKTVENYISNHFEDGLVSQNDYMDSYEDISIDFEADYEAATAIENIAEEIPDIVNDIPDFTDDTPAFVENETNGINDTVPETTSVDDIPDIFPDVLEKTEKVEMDLDKEKSIHSFSEIDLKSGEEVVPDMMSSKPLAAGFMPFEMREGYKGNTDFLSRDDVSKIRAEIDPGFGKILNVDTTTFVTSGPEKNVSIIRMDYKDIKPHLETSDARFSKENIVPNSIRAIKEYGDSMKVDNVRFGVSNVVTFELKLKGEDIPYRSTFVVDDAGIVHGKLDCQDNLLPLNFNNDGSTHIDKLDRTNVDNPGHIKAFEGKDEAFREKFITSVNEKLPEFWKELNTKVEGILMDRKDAMETKLEIYKAEKDALHNTLNKVELYRESEMSKVAEAKSDLENTLNDINITLSEYRPIAAELDEISDKQRSLNPSDDSYAKLEDQKTALKEKQAALDSKLESLEQKLAEKYDTYKRTESSVDLTSLSNAVGRVEQAYSEAKYRYDALSRSYGSYFGTRVDSGDGVLRRESFVDGVGGDKKYSEEERFQMLCSLEGQRVDLSVVDLKADAIESGNAEFLKTVDERLETIVERYNETVSEPEKIYIGEDKQLYTHSGFQIEARYLPGEGNEFDHKTVSDNYNAKMDKEEHGHGPASPVETDVPGKYDSDSVRFYSIDAPAGSDLNRYEIREKFVDNGIHNKVDAGDMKTCMRKVDSGLTEVGSNKLFVPSQKPDIQKELTAICRCVDNHLHEEKMPDFEQLKDEQKEEFEKIKAEADKVDKGSKDGSVDSEQNNTDSKVDSGNGQDGKSAGRDGGDQFRKQFAGAYAKVDSSKDVAISKDKLESLKEEAKAEAKGDKEKEEKLFNEKKEALEQKLGDIKSDMEHYKKTMESYEGIPSRYLNKYTPFQTAKMEFDSAARAYEKMGGAVGEGQYVTKGVNNLESFMDKIEFLNSNVLESKIYDMILGRENHVRDVYRGDVTDTDGKTESKTHDSYTPFAKIVYPFESMGSTIAEVLNGLISKMVDKMDIMKDNTDKDIRNDADKNEKNDTESKPEDSSSDVSRDDTESKVDDTNTADVDTGKTDDTNNNDVDNDNNDNVDSGTARHDDTDDVDKDDKTDVIITGSKTPDISEKDDDGKDEKDEASKDDTDETDLVNEEVDLDDTDDVEQESDKSDVSGDNIEKEDQESDKNDTADDDENDLEKEFDEDDIDQEQEDLDTVDTDSVPEDEAFNSLGDDTDTEPEDFEESGADNVSYEDIDASEDSTLAHGDETDSEKEKSDTDAALVVSENEVAKDTDADSIKEDISEGIARALAGEETLDSVMQDTIGDAVVDDKLSASEIIDSITDGIKEYISDNDEYDVESIRDVVFETMNMLDVDGIQSPMGVLDMVHAAMESHEVPQELLQEMDAQLADVWNADEKVLNPDEYGTIDDYQLSADGATDMFMGNEFDYASNIDALETHMQDFADNFSLNDFDVNDEHMDSMLTSDQNGPMQDFEVTPPDYSSDFGQDTVADDLPVNDVDLFNAHNQNNDFNDNQTDTGIDANNNNMEFNTADDMSGSVDMDFSDLFL